MNTCAGKIYRTRDPEASPFFALVRDYFDEFEQVYPEQFQKQYGYWRSVIRNSDKFRKCGDLYDLGGFDQKRIYGRPLRMPELSAVNPLPYICQNPILVDFNFLNG